MRIGDFTVPSHELKVEVEIPFDTQSVGAQTSATDSANKGIKPKEVSVSLLIKKTDAASLTKLTAIAQAVKADGSRTVYTLTDETANAMNIRQCRFDKRFVVQEHNNLKAWMVSFTLVEFNSVPEKVEKRQTTTAAKPQAATGTAVAATNEKADSAAADDKDNQSFLFNILKGVDQKLS